MNPDTTQSAVSRTTEYNRRLDKELLEKGVVNKGLFTDFAAVQIDPNASSVGWLEEKLRVLSVRVSTGASLLLHEPMDGTFKTISTLTELVDWADQHFPIARFRL